MRTYTSEELIRTQFESVSVSLGEINSDNNKGACNFFCCKGKAAKNGGDFGHHEIQEPLNAPFS